jgi:hypothetical protein
MPGTDQKPEDAFSEEETVARREDGANAEAADLT